ncbi:MAG: hypothetical protein ACOY0T_32370 [Myxococcota bacterium]
MRIGGCGIAVLGALAALVSSCGGQDKSESNAGGATSTGGAASNGGVDASAGGRGGGNSQAGAAGAQGGSAVGTGGATAAQGGTAAGGTSSGGGAQAGGGAGKGSGNASSVEDLERMGCVTSRSDAELIPPILEFVVDTSGSMNESVQGGAVSKWEVTREALISAIDELPNSTGVGLLFFPNMRVTASQCVRTDAMIPVDRLGTAGSAQRVALTSAIAAVEPQSVTPTFDAYEAGLDLGLLASKMIGTRYMVLLTDGAPTVAPGCGLGPNPGTEVVDPAPIVALIEQAAQGDIRTFIVGAPGSEESINGQDARSAWLSAAASAGGTAPAGCSNAGPNFCHIDLTQSADFGAALRQSLAEIAASVTSCSYQLPAGLSSDASTLNLVYVAGDGTRTLLRRDASVSCSEGWQLGDGFVSLCSTACRRIKADPAARIQAFVGCSSAAK